MNSGEMMVVFIVAIVMIASIIKAVLSGPKHVVFNQDGNDTKIKAETIRLHEELAQLKDRVKVLERIAIEKEDSLTKQIEELRDR